MESIIEKLKFSPRAERVRIGILNRIKEWSYREGTLTNLEYDGKTPFVDTFEEYADKEPYVVVLAKAIVKSWLDSPVVIYPDEILVGVNRPTRFFVEHFSWGLSNYSWVSHMTNFTDNNGDVDLYAKYESEVMERAKKIWDKMFIKGTGEMERAEREFFGGVQLNGLWGPGGFQGHTVPGYDKLLRLGFDGTLEEIKKYDSNTNDKEKHDLYRAMEIIVRGLSAFAESYSVKAEQLMKEADSNEEKQRLALIAGVCMKVAHDVPTNYHEAAQLCWFYSLWDWVDSVGRTDRYLYPFFERDDRDELKREITCDLVMKFWEHGVHNMTLGGVDTETGEDSTNDLTYLLLSCVRTIHDTHPRVSLRVNKNTPKALMRLAIDMWSEGMSDPTLASDSLIIEGLREYGVSLRDARDYSLLGCQEIEIQGKSNFGCEDGSFNVAKILEYTLNGGRDAGNGDKIVPYGKPLHEYENIDEIWEAFEKNVKHLTGPFCHLCDLGQKIRDVKFAKLVKSVYTDDCIAKGINLDGGGAVYNYGVVETVGIAVVADSFAVLESLVFDSQKVSLTELESAMKAEYKGYDELRRVLLDAPKFGNDCDIADKWAKKTLEMFWGELRKYKSIRGGAYMGACSLLNGGTQYGECTAALPDGHRRGDPLGNTMGPRPGADKNGITAMLKSVSKLPLHLGLGGTTLNALVPCSENATEENKEKIIALFRTFLENGGQLVQITTASKEQMLEAKASPEEHRDLLVRIGGYSCRFVELNEKDQDEMISRHS